MTRFTDCETRTGRVLLLVDGVPAGAAAYRSTLELTTNANAAAFTVKLTIQVQGSTLPAGSAADFEPDCDHPCATNSSLTGSMAPGATYSYIDTTRSHHQPELTVTITPPHPRRRLHPARARCPATAGPLRR
jgi:hypothetical protein